MPSIDRTLPDKLRDNVLRRAADRNMPLQISVVSGGDEGAGLKSRMLGAKGGEHPKMIIEIPTKDGTPVPMHPGDAANVIIKVGEERYGFRTKVTKRGRMDLGGGKSVSVVEFAYPRQVLHLQRRRFYRIDVSAIKQMEVRCVTGKESDGSGESMRLKGRILDLSSGGMAMRMPRSHSQLADVGRQMAVMFKLPDFVEPVKLMSVIRHVRPVEKSEDKV